MEPPARRFSALEHPLLLEPILHTVFSFLDSPQDRRSVSEVCRQWYEMDCETRQHIYIAFVYSVSPSTLSSRFRNITGLKLKAKPRAYEFNLLPDNWGGHATPWILEIVSFPNLSELHLRRMEVSDDDLAQLASGFTSRLRSLKLDFCTGFSTIGLREVTRSCRNLRLLYLENSYVSDKGGEWLHELALHNTTLETLSFQLAIGIARVSVEDIKAIIKNCPGLRCLKLGEGEAALGDGLMEVLSRSTSLRELGVFLSAGELDEDHQPNNNNNPMNGRRRFELPKSLCSISGDIPPCLFWPIASQLIKLDLMTVTEFTAQQHHELLRRCPKLQNLQVRTIIGDEGLRIVGRSCKELLKVRIEEQSDADAYVSHLGLMSLAEGCANLQKLAIYVSDISNAALLALGHCCPNLQDFRLILIEALTHLSDPTLDSGFEGVMRGCSNLIRLCIYVRQGTITDDGMARIGRHSSRLKALLLGCVGDSDHGFLALASGCRSLERLEMRDCPFTDNGLVRGVGFMPCLKLLWLQGFDVGDTVKLSRITGRFNVECTRRGPERHPVQCVIYRSLAGPRPDCPEEIVQLNAERNPNGH